MATAHGDAAHERGSLYLRPRASTARASSIPWWRWISSGLVLAKLTDDVVSLRFLLFAMVGSIGLIVHLLTLFIAHEVFNVVRLRKRRPSARLSP